jgi:succinate-acetate transporter protein
MKQSDAFGLVLLVSFGLWWMVAPMSVITFYHWFHRGISRRAAKPMAVRIAGLFWVVLVIVVFVFGARR